MDLPIPPPPPLPPSESSDEVKPILIKDGRISHVSQSSEQEQRELALRVVANQARGKKAGVNQNRATDDWTSWLENDDYDGREQRKPNLLERTSCESTKNAILIN